MAAHSGNPLVSIIVPSFRHGRFIAGTLDSILLQSYRPLEVIVTDGGSKDETVEILKSYSARYPELRWISEPDKGVADAVNKGLAMANGEIVGIQSSDDLYYADAIADAVKTFNAHPECGMVYGDSDTVDEDARLLWHYHVPEFSLKAFFGIALCLPQSSIFFRMKLAREMDGWNGKYFSCDLDYWMRMLLRAPAVKIPRALSAWRTYPEQRTQAQHNKKIWDGYWQMVADCHELKTAPPQVQQWARASCHVLALRHHPTENPWALRWHVLCALMMFPGFWRYWSVPSFWRLLPGYVWARSLYRWWRPKQPVTPGQRIVPAGPNPTGI